MINISYIRLLNAFESFSNAHLQIKRFASDFPEQVPNFGTEKENYPILFVSPNNTIFDENANQFTVDVYCFDIIEKDRININTILSDTNTILNDVYRWFKDGEIFGIDVIDDTPTCTPINNGLLDYAAGWQMSITFVVDTYGICEIPFNESPVVITEVCDIVYSQYLTCETLADCQTIIDIQALLPTQDQKDAMDNANGPDSSNPFATMADVGGGGTLDLQQVTDNGNTTDNDIQFDAGVGVLLDNGSRLREGTIDAGFGGTKGIAQICAVGYELKWEAGRQYVMDGNGVLIRHSLNNFTTVPSATDDSSKGYYVGSLWTLDNLVSYICTDSTIGAAVWDLYFDIIPNLQQVTDEGAITTNTITIGDVANDYSQILPTAIGTENSVNGTYAYLDNNGQLGLHNGTAESDLKNTNVTNAGVVLEFPNKVTGSYTIATTIDVPAAQVNSDWNAVSGVAEILNKPTIPAAQVNSDWNASSGLAEILNKPTIPAAQIQSDWNQTNNTLLDYIKNKPTIPSGTVTSVAAITLGTTGTDLNSTVATGTTTPVITLNVPDASATARGVITTGTQTIAGAKTFSGAISASNLSGTNTGDQDLSSLAPKASPTFTGTVVLPATTSIGNVSDVELGYLDGVTSAIQTQINSKSEKSILLFSSALNPADSSDYYFSIGYIAATTTPNQKRFKFDTGSTTAIKLVLQMSNTSAGSNELVTLNLRNQTTGTDYLIGSFDMSLVATNTNWLFEFAFSHTINTTDQWLIKMTTPAWVTNPTAAIMQFKLYYK